MTTAASTHDSNTATWNAQFAALKTRYPHVRDAILTALHIVSQNPSIAVDDAKAQAKLLGTRITAASVSAAQRLMSRQDRLPAATANKAGTTAPQRPARRARPTDTAFDTEALVRGVVAKIQGQGSVEADRLRDAMRKAIAILTAAVG